MARNPLIKLFTDETIIDRIQNKLPKLFAVAELESSRDGKIGMEVGSVREQILVALLVSVFGEKDVKTEIPITRPEEDVEVLGKSISIKTITGNGGIKVVWTVDAQKAREFYESYRATCDILLVVINWENKQNVDSGLFLIPKKVQDKILEKISKENYLKLPKEGTNPRGVELSRIAIEELKKDSGTHHIDILWSKDDVHHKTYQRWLDLWNE